MVVDGPGSMRLTMMTVGLDSMWFIVYIII